MSVVQLPSRVTIGGSSAAAAAGIDPYRSRVMLWAELTGRVAREESEAMRWGNRLQDAVIAELRERGYDVYDPGIWGMVEDPERPWLVGHPDGFIGPPGEGDLLEVKTAGPFAGKWDDRPPLHYEAQCQVYLHLTGLQRALLACLVGGQRLVLREVERDERAIALLLAAMEDLIGYVQRDEPPPPDGSESSRNALAELYPQASGRVHRLTADEYLIYRDLLEIHEAQDRLAEQRRERENILKAAMGDAETAITPNDAPAINWRNVSSQRVDTKALREQRPELASLFTTTTETRRFTLA